MFGSHLKIARQRASDLAVEIAGIKKQRASIGDSAVEDGRSLTADERSRFVAFGRQIEKLEADLAANAKALAEAEEQNESERNYRGPVEVSDGRGGSRIVGGDGSSPLTRPRGRKFADLFPQAATATDGWQSSGEYLQVIGRGLHDQRLRADSMHESTGSSGGFAVPTQLLGTWLDASLESEIVRSRCTSWPMTTSEVKVPALDDADRSSGAIANLELRFEAELSTLDPQIAKLRMVTLKARRGAIFLEASNDLLQDSPSFDANITAALVKVLSFGLDNRFLFGNGADGPLGALVAPCAIVVARATAAKIQYEDVLSMFSRLTPGSVGQSVWVASPSTIPQLATMSVAVGTGGNAIPVMTNANGEFTILTRPVIFSEKAKALGTQSDLSLCDFASYAVGIRREATLDKSLHVGFARDVETYRLQVRIDGQPTLAGPITPLNGSTLSPFVTLGNAA